MSIIPTIDWDADANQSTLGISQNTIKADSESGSCNLATLRFLFKVISENAFHVLPVCYLCNQSSRNIWSQLNIEKGRNAMGSSSGLFEIIVSAYWSCPAWESNVNWTIIWVNSFEHKAASLANWIPVRRDLEPILHWLLHSRQPCHFTANESCEAEFP